LGLTCDQVKINFPVGLSRQIVIQILGLEFVGISQYVHFRSILANRR
jgi:hypothetical protein